MGCLTFAQSLESRLDSILALMTTTEKYNLLYYNTDGITRLGIPQFMGNNGPHGIGVNGSTSFPVTIGMAATWDLDMVQRIGAAIGTEGRSLGLDRVAGPSLDLLGDPRNGRAGESIGEDPFLGGRTTEAFYQGLFSSGLFGTIKHYNLNTRETGRESNNYVIDQRSLIELWGCHWKRAVQYGGALSVMCAFNLVNGGKCAENFNLINTILRTKWGFSYYTMCDWGGFNSAEKAMKAELDFCEGNDLYQQDLPGLVSSGTITMAMVENADKNVLRAKLVSGMIDGKPTVPSSARNSDANKELCYQAGLRAIVLLKNTGNILPISKNIVSVALIGPSADVCQLDGFGSSSVTPAYTITPRQSIDSVIGSAKVRYAKGCDINSTDQSGFAAAMSAAQGASVVVFVGGLDYTQEGEGYGIGGDRKSGSINLPGQQQNLINQLATVNPNIVVVVESGGMCGVDNSIANIKALLYGFYPGQEGGKAVASVLFGDYNPSGKLPVTMPKGDSQLPPWGLDFTNVVQGRLGYRWFDTQNLMPEFPFGYGLSYTTFAYSNLKITPDNAPIGTTITVTADIKNTGNRAGEEVAQLYLKTGAILPALPMPPKQLRGFEKISINPGETKTVDFTLTPEELYVFDTVANCYKVPTGAYSALVGGSSGDLPLMGNFTLTDDSVKPDLIVVNIRSVPPYPKAGDKVIFIASIINKGTGPSPAGTVHGVSFNVDGNGVAYSANVTSSIPAGGMALASATSGPAGSSAWTATSGTHSVSARVDYQNIIAECNEDNNVAYATITLPGGKLIPVPAPPTTQVSYIPVRKSKEQFALALIGKGNAAVLRYSLGTQGGPEQPAVLSAYTTGGRLIGRCNVQKGAGEIKLYRLIGGMHAASVLLFGISDGKNAAIVRDIVVE
jgi:beta-glucosidase